MAFGFRNTIKYYSNKHWGFPEDNYFCNLLGQYDNCLIHRPTADEACAFAFEKSPAFLFEKTNHTLPFGCHAWEKYDKDFWHDKINAI